MPYLTSAATQEITFPGTITSGDKGVKVKRVQEWLCFHNSQTGIDSDFGSATDLAVKKFQTKKGLPSNGTVNRATWDALVAPLLSALSASVPAGVSFDDAVLRVAKAHLREHPIELGGDNRGPWVRTYCSGSDGSDYLWCAGFVTFVLKQASNATGSPNPIAGSLSCDSLAYQARQSSRFVPGTAVASGATAWNTLGRCQIFLVRRTSTDWTHTGFSFDGSGNTFSTIEGNTNDDGNRNGYEVCQRSRSVPKKDFINIA